MESGKKMVWRRGSCLDEETCEACKNADGTVISGEDADLGKICTSESGCRCIPYSDLDEKGT
jgi:hypothetical protein